MYPTAFMLGRSGDTTSVGGNYFGLNAKKNPPEAGQHKNYQYISERKTSIQVSPDHSKALALMHRF